MSRWEPRFFATTRGQIVMLLRRARRTVDDLAGALDLTDNAVRAHLTSLERDGLVRQHGVRRGERRPSVVYELTIQAEELFPKAYEPVLSQLLDVLHERLGPGELEASLRDAGRRLAPGRPPQVASARERLELAAAVLSELGGLADIEQLEDGRMAIRGLSCPLVVRPSVQRDLCQVATALVTEVTGLEVEELCARPAGERPRCMFVLGDEMGVNGRDATEQ